MKPEPILILAGDAGWLPILGASAGSPAGDPLGVDDTGVTLRESDFLPDAEAVLGALRAVSSQPKADGPLPRTASVAEHPGVIPGVVIGLASHRCFAARVDTGGLPARQLRQALPYRFETTVPFAVEDLVLDIHGQGDGRLVVATRFEPIHAFVHALEDAGVTVHGVAPLALLAAQSMPTNTEPRGDGGASTTLRVAEPSVLCESQMPSVSEVELASHDSTGKRTPDAISESGSGGSSGGNSGGGSGGGEILAWRWLPGSSCGGAEAQSEQTEVAKTLRCARSTVQRVVVEEEPLWVNLQRGPLASRHPLDRVRRPLTACLIAAAVFLIAFTGAVQVRAWQYRDAAARYDEHARSLYEDAFPGETVPVSMDRRLKTRLRELRGRQGLATPDARLYNEESTLAVVHDLLERLPEDTRLIITDLRLGGNRIDLVGHARSHSDADRIAAALRQDGRFEVTPPSTENLPGQGVQFSLHVTPVNGAGNTDDDASGTLAAEHVSAAGQPNNSPAPTRGQGGTP